MNLLIHQLSQIPIYEQLENQIRQAILQGELKSNEMLPSIRGMAKDLGIGVITVKRAYDDLCQQGYLVSLQGRGVFVAEINKNQEHMLRMEQLRERIGQVKSFCDTSAITKQELLDIIEEIWRNEL